MKNCKKCQSSEKLCFSHIVHEWLCENCKIILSHELDALRCKFLSVRPANLEDDGFFPPPWDWVLYPEKTEGWNEFQKEARKHPEYYSL